MADPARYVLKKEVSCLLKPDTGCTVRENQKAGKEFVRRFFGPLFGPIPAVPRSASVNEREDILAGEMIAICDHDLWCSRLVNQF